MRELLVGADGPVTVLALGAHCDDVEIGAGGTLLRLAQEVPDLRAHVVVLTSTPERAREAEASAAAFLAPHAVTTQVHGLRDGRLPAAWDEVKDLLGELAASCSPDLVIAPSPDDAHQDHALLGSLVPTAFRDHLVLRYEIPKWDGDLGAGRPTHYVGLTPELAQRKVALLDEHFPSQRGHDWWDPEVFLGLARLRGMEARTAYAEAFSVGKAVLGFAPRTSGVERRDTASGAWRAPQQRTSEDSAVRA